MSIAVIDKTFSILEVLARTGRALTLAELAEESRLPKPTVHRILKSLRDLGYVNQAGRGGTYELSARLATLREYGRDEAVREKVRPLMARLHPCWEDRIEYWEISDLDAATPKVALDAIEAHVLALISELEQGEGK